MPQISSEMSDVRINARTDADTSGETSLESRYRAIGIKAVAAAASFRSHKGKPSDRQPSVVDLPAKGEPRET
jgi:hypothetical protein